MLIDSHIKKLFLELLENRQVEISLLGSLISVYLDEEGRKVHLSSPVYWGGNYIPNSVRTSLSKRPPFDEGIIRAIPKIDEDQFEISLHCIERSSEVNTDRFIVMLEEFSHLAVEWKDLLDQHDKNDLVYVRAPSS